MDDERLKGIVEALAGPNVLSYALNENGVLVVISDSCFLFFFERCEAINSY